MGPTLIFDKSFLQSLSVDESVWLDTFFLTNITPLFFIETLADLEKQIRTGRTPEDVVGNLAYKTPDLGSKANVHHTTLLAGELTGKAEIDMRFGRPLISGGTPVELDGKKGVIFRQDPEEEALQRWQRQEFLELERTTAKAWRQALSNVDFNSTYQFFRSTVEQRKKPKTLLNARQLAESIIDSPDQEKALTLGMTLLGVSRHGQAEVLARWNAARRPPIRKFAPYFSYVLSVELFFYLAMGSDLISRERPSHKVDLAYLYYLPFCTVFTSNDNLHATLAPLFLRDHQTFVGGTDLKADLASLDEYYSRLPEEVLCGGISSFAMYPPADRPFLVSELWDKHLPLWRKHLSEPRRPLDKQTQAELLKIMNRFEKESTPLDPKAPIVPSELDSMMMIVRQVYPRKGKWRRFPPEVEKEKNQ